MPVAAPVPLPAWRPAYGWPADILEEDALAKLLEINLARAALNSGEEEVEIAEDSELGDD